MAAPAVIPAQRQSCKKKKKYRQCCKSFLCCLGISCLGISLCSLLYGDIINSSFPAQSLSTVQDFNELCPAPLSEPEHRDLPTVTRPGWSSLESGISLLLTCLGYFTSTFWVDGGVQRIFLIIPGILLQGVFVHPSALIFIHGNVKVVILPVEFSFAQQHLVQAFCCYSVY